MLPADVTDPRFRAFFAYWRSVAPAEDRLPGRQHLDPLTRPRDLLPHVALYDVVPAGNLRFRCRLAGTGVVDLPGVDNTGRFIDETMSAEAYRPLHRSYCAVVRHGLPQYWQRNVPYAHRDFAALQRLALPLAADGVAVDMVISYYVPVPRVLESAV